MKPGLTISCLGHAVALLWGLVAFAAKPNDAPAVEPLPVEFVSATEFSQLTAGVKNAPKPLEQPKPLADKVGEPNPAKQLAAKVADKPDVITDSAPPPSPSRNPSRRRRRSRSPNPSRRRSPKQSRSRSRRKRPRSPSSRSPSPMRSWKS